jgi:SP family myo-inositol transporter-like MFS transporter 13
MADHLFEKGEKTDIEFRENILERGGDEAAMAVAELDAIEQTPVSRYVWLVTITCSVAGALFGYDTGISTCCEGILHRAVC